MSEKYTSPPGARARYASRSTAALSGDRFTTQLEMMRSMLESAMPASPRRSIWPSTKRRLLLA